MNQLIRKNKRRFSFFLRTAVSLALIVGVFYRVGLDNVWQILRQARIDCVLLSIAITPVLIAVSSWKWQVILRAYRIRVSFFRLFGLYAVGYFFNTVLPTNVGGDVVRAYALGKSTGRQAEAFSSVFVERFTGLTALLAMAILAFFLAIRSLWDIGLSFALLVSLVGYGSILLLLLNPSLVLWIRNRLRIKLFQSVLDKIIKVQNAILTLRNAKRALLFAMANSFLFYAVAVLNVYISALAFRAPITLIQAVIITPIVLVITMIPVSIGGIGLSESAYAFTFARLDVGMAFGLSVALFMRLKALLAGVFGGLYYSALGIRIQADSVGLDTQVERGDVQGDVNYFSGFEGVMRQKKSSLKKYMDIVSGNYSLWRLIRFETTVGLFGYLPGLPGYFLRQLFYRPILGGMGKGTVFGRSVSLRHAQKIRLGKRCVVDEYCSLSAQGDASSAIRLGDEVLLGRSTVLGTRNGEIEIGDFSNIGANCRLGTTTRIRFGKHVLLAANCYIGGAQHRFDRLDVPIMRQGYDSRGGVVIEDDVWLGAGVMVLDGVRIGTGCVVGAGSVVTKNLPPYSVAVGVPARIVGNRRDSSEDIHQS
ncbi:flippase-like domain-containing protein [candidate division KSB1 bacterium]|nr:flippase-like domain-containing protein [candidate division KSB1 bacterium]